MLNARECLAGAAAGRLQQVVRTSLGEPDGEFSFGDGQAMIAERLPAASDLATKADIQALERRIDQLEIRQLRWTVGLFMPLWIAVLVMLAAIVVKL